MEVTIDDLVGAVKEAVDDRIEAEKAETTEAIKVAVAEALAPFEERLTVIEDALGVVTTAVNQEVGKRQSIDTDESHVSATKSSSHRDAWGRRVRNAS